MTSVGPLISDPVLVGLAATGGVALTAAATLGTKLLNRGVDTADAQAKRSASKKDDLEVLRGVIAELREEKTEARTRIEALEERMAKLEERERHGLTRAAVHEAWDQLTFQLIVASHPQHPPPPPLRDPAALPPGDNGDPA